METVAVTPRPTPAASTNNMTRAIFYLFFALLVIGGLNWLLYGINKDYDLVALLGGLVDSNDNYNFVSRIVYALVGVSALAATGLAAGNTSAIFNSTSSSSLTGFYVLLALLVVGGLNWGLYAIDKDWDLVAFLGGLVDSSNNYNFVSRGVYGFVGASAVGATILAASNSSSIYASN